MNFPMEEQNTALAGQIKRKNHGEGDGMMKQPGGRQSLMEAKVCKGKAHRKVWRSIVQTE